MVLKRGTKVRWWYRQPKDKPPNGHGKVDHLIKKGKTADRDEYAINETDHHKGEAETVHHYRDDMEVG